MEVPCPPSPLAPLLKGLIADCDPRAHILRCESTSVGGKLSEGLLVSVLSRSADAKSLRFAEEVLQWCRSQRRTTVAVYSATMKVYAYCGLYDCACDLYPEICEQGLVPDSTRYGCLMRFSVECGRTELSKQLAERAPQLDRRRAPAPSTS